MSLTIPNTIANGIAADGNDIGANFTAIKAWADLTDAAIESSIPTGSMSLFAGGVAPDGWLFCRGQSLNRAAYPALFAVIGTTFGSLDGDSFTLPDMRGRFPVGLNSADSTFDALNEQGGSKDAIVVAHTHTGPSHTHSFSATTGSDTHSHSVDPPSTSTSSAGAHQHGPDAGSAFIAQAGSGGTLNLASGLNYTTPLKTDSAGNHTHTVNIGSFTSGSDTHSHSVSGTTGAGGTGNTGSTGSSATNANLPPFIVLNFIIKT